MYPPCVCTGKRACDICMWVWSCVVSHVSHSGCQACTAVAQTTQSSPLRHLPGFEPTNLTPRGRNSQSTLCFCLMGRTLSFGCKEERVCFVSEAQSNKWVDVALHGESAPPSEPGFRHQQRSIFGHCGHHHTSLVTVSASNTSSVLSWWTCVCWLLCKHLADVELPWETAAIGCRWIEASASVVCLNGALSVNAYHISFEIEGKGVA